MGVYKRGKSWILDFYYGGTRYYESVGPVNRTVAKEKLVIRKREVIQGLYKPKAAIVQFDKFKDLYLEYSESNKKKSSYGRDISSLKNLSKVFSGKTLSQIAPFSVERYKTTRRDQGVAPATINRELGCLRHMFNIAIKWGKVQANPVTGVSFLKEPKEKDRILTYEEEIQLLETVRTGHKSKHLENIIIVALHTGMRKGEILNLKWSQVNFRNGYIVVEGTKTNDIRKVPMNKTLTNCLKSIKSKDAEYVFTENRKPYTDVKRAWWTALERAGIKDFRFHDLRHTFGSRLGMAGFDIKTIGEIMGHKDVKMTMRYSHPTPEHKVKAVQSLDRSHSDFHSSLLSQGTTPIVSIGHH